MKGNWDLCNFITVILRVSLSIVSTQINNISQCPNYKFIILFKRYHIRLLFLEPITRTKFRIYMNYAPLRTTLKVKVKLLFQY